MGSAIETLEKQTSELGEKVGIMWLHAKRCLEKEKRGRDAGNLRDEDVYFGDRRRFKQLEGIKKRMQELRGYEEVEREVVELGKRATRVFRGEYAE
jgi:hypothetical protein